MLLAPVLGAPPREIAERLGESSSAGALGDELEQLGDRRAGLPQPVHVRRLVPASLRARSWTPAIASAAAAPSPPSGSWSSSCQPTRPARWWPPAAERRLRRRAVAILEHHGHESPGSTTSTTPGARSACWETRSRRGARRRDPRGRLPGRLRARARRTDPRRAVAERGRRGQRGGQPAARADQGTLLRYGVHYDQFFSERSLHAGARATVQRALAIVERGRPQLPLRGRAWLRTHQLRRRQGPGRWCAPTATPTYLAADIGYLLEKRERGSSSS